MGLYVGASALFFHWSRNAALKRTLFPIFWVVLALGWTAVVYRMAYRQDPEIFFVFVTLLILSSFFNIRMMRFCDACGRTLRPKSIFQRDSFCRHCGSKLE